MRKIKTDEEIRFAMERCGTTENKSCEKCPYYTNTATCVERMLGDALELINRQQAEIESLQRQLHNSKLHEKECYEARRVLLMEKDHDRVMTRAEAVKEVVESIDKYLKRYSHLHKYADEVKHSKEEYEDGTPMEMVSVWDVLSLEKYGMVDCETMYTLQDNIETIAIVGLLTEIEKDFCLFKKEMVGDAE